MRRLVLALAICFVAHSASAQTSADKSTSSKFFVGVGFEGAAISTNVATNVTETESGSGAGVVVGYGFTPTWALYGNISGANIQSVGGSYGLGHFDVGARVHFRAGPNTVVPFLQFGLDGRAVSADFHSGSTTRTVTASGTGVAVGAGLNAHFTRAFAFSGAVTWSFGSFTNFTVDNGSVPSSSISATSARVHIGIIWFPQAK